MIGRGVWWTQPSDAAQGGDESYKSPNVDFPGVRVNARLAVGLPRS